MTDTDQQVETTPRMRVRIIEDAATVSGKAIMLCDEAGEPLPQQISARVFYTAGAEATISVTFFIDGKDVALG